MKVVSFAEAVSPSRIKITNYPVFTRDGTLYVSDLGDFGKINGRILRFDPGGNGQVWARGALNFANDWELGAEENYL